MMAIIYLYYQPSSFMPGDVLGVALAEDGTILGSHVSSTPNFAEYDLKREGHQKAYREHYPDGYELMWIGQPDNHAGFERAWAQYQLRRGDYGAINQPE